MSDYQLIIGGSGFVGSHLIEAILEEAEGSTIVMFDNLSMGKIGPLAAKDFPRVALRVGDATETLQHLKYIESAMPNKIWHLAANSDISKSAVSSNVDLEATFGTTAETCLAILKKSYLLESLVFSSTSAVFGPHLEPICEDSPCQRESSYGWVKLSSEKLTQSLFSSGAIEKVLVTRFPNVTGIRQGHGVVKKLVSKYFDTNEEWTILGDGFQEKPYIHARELEDVLLAVEATLEPGPLLQINILSDTTSTVRAITEEIESYGQKERTPRFGQTAYGWKGGIPKYEFDTSKLKLLGIQVSPSRDAITRSVREEVATYID